MSLTLQEQLNNLMTVLRKTQPHFVRCIIPNERKEAGKVPPTTPPKHLCSKNTKLISLYTQHACSQSKSVHLLYTRMLTVLSFPILLTTRMLTTYSSLSLTKCTPRSLLPPRNTTFMFTQPYSHSPSHSLTANKRGTHTTHSLIHSYIAQINTHASSYHSYQNASPCQP